MKNSRFNMIKFMLINDPEASLKWKNPTQIACRCILQFVVDYYASILPLKMLFRNYLRNSIALALLWLELFPLFHIATKLFLLTEVCVWCLKTRSILMFKSKALVFFLILWWRLINKYIFFIDSHWWFYWGASSAECSGLQRDICKFSHLSGQLLTRLICFVSPHLKSILALNIKF